VLEGLLGELATNLDPRNFSDQRWMLAQAQRASQTYRVTLSEALSGLQRLFLLLVLTKERWGPLVALGLIEGTSLAEPFSFAPALIVAASRVPAGPAGFDYAAVLRLAEAATTSGPG